MRRLALTNSQISNKGMKGFAIHPKLDCPHLSPSKVDSLCQYLLTKNDQHFSQFKCAKCEDKTQNWICMECHTIACSRYVNGHMATHHDETKHQITLSFSDSSFWCYQCDSYIDHPILIKARKQFSNSKFASIKQNQKNKKTDKQQQLLQQALKKMDLNQQNNQKFTKQEQNETNQKSQQTQENAESPKEFTYEQIIQKLKNKEYKKVVFLTGAGLSVAAGIPDFRTPGTGIYSQLQKYNLPRPQSLFQLSFFLKNPQPFLKIAKEWHGGNFQPTAGHKFIKKMQDQNLLYYCMTQNIDDLESKAGVSAQKLIQAHGHSRSAHCTKCKVAYSVEDWVKHLEKQQPMYCTAEQCKSLVKPDIVFFGEQLPKQFFSAPQYMKNADLVIIIGTSLVVFPFAFLAHGIQPNTAVLLINNQDSLSGRKNKVWLKGDIQQNIHKICHDLNWTL